MSTNARVKGTYPLSTQVQVARITLHSQDVANWQSAVNAARSELMPRRKSLLEMYDNLTLDGHLQSVMGKRVLNVGNKPVIWLQDGAADAFMHAMKKEVLNTPWFYDFITGSMSVVAYGSTVLELVPVAGKVGKCEVFPRANVVSEFGYIAQDAVNTMQPWIYYRDDPYWSTYLVEVGKPRDLGALVIASLLALHKRGQFGDWAQYNELFGMPFRTGKYNPWDDTTRTKLYTALSEMGGAGFAVIPNGTEVDFHNATGTAQGQGTYKDLIELCNSEMSKLFLGQTMTTDDGASRSQGQVHKEVEDDITLADMRRTEFLLNWELRPRLVKLGYPMDKGEFAFDQTRNLPLETRIDLDIKVAKQLGDQVPDRYWYDTYGIPMPGKGDTIKGGQAPGPDTPPKEDTPEPPEEPDPAPKRKPTDALEQRLRNLYHGGHLHHPVNAGEDGEGAPDAILDELARAIHDGRITEGYVDPKLMQWTADQLMAGVLGGMDIEDDAEQEEELREFMQRNVAVFSGFKTYHTLRKATDQLMDDDGKVVPFATFKRRILAIDQTYNVRFLKAEYAHAVAAGQGAERWQDAQRDKDLFPFLRLNTAGDDRVRPKHAVLDGVTKPVDDPFWDTHWVPLEWGCRCDIDQVMSAEGGRELPANYSDERSTMFKNNVGKNGIVFPSSHPYFTAPKGIKEEVQKQAEAMVPKRTRTPKKPKPQGTPVSKAIATTVRKLKPVAERSLAALDSVHGDGELENIPLVNTTKRRVFGFYRSQAHSATEIAVRTTGHHQHLTFLHEIGHWIDHMALGRKQRSKWGSHANEDMRAVMDALAGSPTIQRIRQVGETGYTTGTDGLPVRLMMRERYYYEYLNTPHEQWARAYAQYIATRSGDAEILKELKREQAKGGAPTQWPDDEFKPIAKAIDVLLQRKGWQATK